MKIFLIWSNGSQKDLDFIAGLKRSGHEIIYWTARKVLKEDAEEMPGTILHDHWDAWIGIPPKELADSKFDPPEAELIKKMSSAEAIIMTMMNKHFEGMCVDERKHFYYNNLRYWHGALNKIKPDLILMDGPPHPDYCYLVFELARLLKINTLIFEHTWVSGRLVWYNDICQGSVALSEEMEKNKNKKFTLDDLSEDLRQYVKFNTNGDNDTTPSYLKEARKKNSFGNRIILKMKIIGKSLKDFTFPKKVAVYFKKLLINNIQKEYRCLQDFHPDLSKNFIYAPLQYQPECSTSPMGGIFVDQILMIQILAATVPEGWLVYVKEHPAQWMSFGLNYTDYRYPGYYKKIAEIKNVRLVPVGMDTFSLIKKSQAVATATGTAGWEALLRQKPALVFGNAWYKDCPGSWRISGPTSCRQAIKEIENGNLPDYQSLINYLKCFELASVRYHIEGLPEEDMESIGRECAADFLALVNRELKKL